MASETPISPPTISTTASPSAPATSNDIPPISPVTRSGTFKHKTSPAVPPVNPTIDTSTPAINDTPVEIDGVATSPEQVRRRETGGSGKGVVSPDLGEEEEVAAEFLNEGKDGVIKESREKRAAMLATRSKDPAVLVNLPGDPTAEEVEAAKSADGTVTPGLPPVEKESGQEKR